jgi:hypothetical protein
MGVRPRKTTIKRITWTAIEYGSVRRARQFSFKARGSKTFL